MIHIGFKHQYFKSRREEWAVRVWRDVKYKQPKKPKPAPYKVEPSPLTLAKLIPDGEGIKQEER